MIIEVNNINKITFSGIKPKKELITKSIKKSESKLDYSKFDPYFIRILIDEGCSLSEIAHDIKQKVGTTRHILEHFGLKTQIAMLLDAIKPEELKKMLSAKKSQKEIAEYFMIDDVAALTPLIKKIGGNTATQNKVNTISKEDLQKLADDGLTFEKIGEIYHVAAKFIRDRMKELGIKTKRELIQEKTISIEEIKYYLFDLGLNVSEIAEKKGIPTSKIYKIMKDNKIQTVKQQITERIPTKKEFLKARKNCSTLKEYMEKLGIGRDKAIKYMAKYNIKPFKIVIKDPSNILELLKKNPNMSINEIAKELDLPPRSIDSAVSKFKIHIMHTCNIGPLYYAISIGENFNKKIAMGDTPIQLGEQYGLSSERIVEIIDRVNSYLIENMKFTPSNKKYLIKNYKLSTCKQSPDKEIVENCIKNIGGSWKKIQNDYYTSYENYLKKIRKICSTLKISQDTLEYLIKKYNIS